jgi:ribosomal protein L4
LKDRLVDSEVYLFDTIDYPKTQAAVEILNTLSAKTGNKAKNTVILYTSEDKAGLSGFVSSEARLMNAANLKIVNLVNSKSLVLTPKAKTLLEEKVSN